MKHCKICRRLFQPKPNVPKQKVCGGNSCQRERKRRKWRRWSKLNPDYAKSRQAKVRAWAAAYPDYWKHYRSTHPQYVQRDHQRRKAALRSSRRSAKQTQWRQILVDKLRLLQSPDSSICSAKQTQYLRRVERIEDCLRSTMEAVCSAKPIPIASQRASTG